MIGSPRFARVQVGQDLVVPFDLDFDGPATWALHASNEVTWMSFPDSDDGTCRGTAPADGGGLLVVQATTADGVQSTAMVVIVVPAGLQAVYAPVTAPGGSQVLATPRVWGSTPPVRWRLANAPVGWTADASTGVLRGPMPPGGGTVSVLVRDSRDGATATQLTLRATPADSFDVRLPDDRVREGGDREVQYVAGQTVVDVLDMPGAVGPFTAAFDAAPPWMRLEAGADVRLTGTADPGQGGLVVVDVTDATGATGRYAAWVVVSRDLPFRLIVPDRIRGDASALFPGELYADILGGTAPYTLAVEQAPVGVAINSITRQITGMFPATVGVSPIRFSATDATGLKVFATMEVETSPADFAIVQPDITTAAGGAIDAQPTVAAGFAARWWAKSSGPDYVTVNTNTGRITGTAPAAAATEELVLFAQATTGERTTRTVRLVTTRAAVGCTVPAVAAERGTAGSVQVVVTNAPAGWTAALDGTHPWASVSSAGVVSWAALDDDDTSTAAIRVTVTRTADGSTHTCSVVPTITDPPVTITCSITGPATLQTGTSGTYRIRSSSGLLVSSTMTATTGATVVSQGAGYYRVTNNRAAGLAFTLSATATDSNATSDTCTLVVTSTAAPIQPPTCRAPTLSWQRGGTASGRATATGGSGGYSFTASGLPSGVTMASNGSLSGGSGVAVGSGSFTVTVTDSGGRTDTCTGTWAVTAAAACPATPALSGTTGTRFSGTLPRPSGITGTLRYSRATGPSWIVVQSNGRYSGTRPNTPTSGTWSYSVSGTGGSCTGAAAAYAVTRPALAASCGSVSGLRNERLTASVSATGGSGGYSYALVSPVAGLSISGSTVTLAAQTTDRTVSYTVRVTDSAGATDTCTGTFTVSGARLALAQGTPWPPYRVQNATYTWRGKVVASGGTPPYRFASRGFGRSAASDGTISVRILGGTTGTIRVAVDVWDSAGRRVSRTFSILRETALQCVRPVGAADPSESERRSGAEFVLRRRVGQEFNFLFTATGGTAPYTWAWERTLDGGRSRRALGVALNNTTGLVFGTARLPSGSSPQTSAAAVGTSIDVTDANGNTGRCSFLIEVTRR